MRLGVLTSLLACAAVFVTASADRVRASFELHIHGVSVRDREFTPSANGRKQGELLVTRGLVCDRPSQVDSVITLAGGGEPLDDAIEQINTGSSVPRCIVGRALFARYAGPARTFAIKGRQFYIHRVLVVAIGTLRGGELVPLRLEKPVEQYVVSADRSTPI